MLQPYLLYLKIFVVAIVIAGILGMLWWINSAINERNALRISDATKTAQIKGYSEAMARDAQVREGINNAIKNIKITSNNYVTAVDNQPWVPVPDGTVVQLVNGGVSKVPSVSTFTNGSTNSRSTIIEAR